MYDQALNQTPLLVEKPSRESYEGWLDYLKSCHDANYYRNLALFSSHVIDDIENMSSRRVADKLKLSTPKLSNLTPILRAISGRVVTRNPTDAKY